MIDLIDFTARRKEAASAGQMDEGVDWVAQVGGTMCPYTPCEQTITRNEAPLLAPTPSFAALILRNTRGREYLE